MYRFKMTANVTEHAYKGYRAIHVLLLEGIRILCKLTYFQYNRIVSLLFCVVVI